MIKSTWELSTRNGVEETKKKNKKQINKQIVQIDTANGERGFVRVLFSYFCGLFGCWLNIQFVLKLADAKNQMLMSTCFLIVTKAYHGLAHWEERRKKNEWLCLQWMTVTASQFHFTVFFDLFTFRIIYWITFRTQIIIIKSTPTHFYFIYFFACFISFHIARKPDWRQHVAKHKNEKNNVFIYIYIFSATRFNECVTARFAWNLNWMKY